MTSQGAQSLIDNLSMRVFEIQETKERLTEEETRLRLRIIELEVLRDGGKPIKPSQVIIFE